MLVGFRAYIDPNTNAGPAYAELLFDRVIHFTAPPPSLELPSKTVETDYPEPTTVSFEVSSTTPGDVSWEAKIEYPDDISGATIEPNQGVISGGNGPGSFEFTADHPGSYSLEITAKTSRADLRPPK